MGFKEMKMMKSTEPSVDEAGKGMKKGGMPMVMKDGKKIPAFAAKHGGKTKKMNMGGAMMPYGDSGMGMKKGGKTKMAMGGTMPAGPLAAASMPMGSRAMPSRPAMGRPAMGRRPDPRAAMLEAAMAQGARAPMMRKKGGEVEGKAMHMKEERQIKGIKKELMTHEDKPASKAHKGLKTGGMPKYATGGVVQKYATGGVVQKYKDGGHAVMACKDGGGFKAMKKGNC